MTQTPSNKNDKKNDPIIKGLEKVDNALKESAAKTVDGGVAFVRWDPTGKSWFIDKDLTAGEVLTSSPLSTSDLIDLGIPSPTISSANAEA